MSSYTVTGDIFDVYKYDSCRCSKINKLKKLLKKAWCKLVTMANLMKDRRVLLTSALYGLLAFTVIMVDLVLYFTICKIWRSHDLFVNRFSRYSW